MIAAASFMDGSDSWYALIQYLPQYHLTPNL